MTDNKPYKNFNMNPGKQDRGMQHKENPEELKKEQVHQKRDEEKSNTEHSHGIVKEEEK